ncbi:hypothetical protein M8C21_016781, partial [Ambrosia artemisiifolia]
PYPINKLIHRTWQHGRPPPLWVLSRWCFESEGMFLIPTVAKVVAEDDRRRSFKGEPPAMALMSAEASREYVTSEFWRMQGTKHKCDTEGSTAEVHRSVARDRLCVLKSWWLSKASAVKAKWVVAIVTVLCAARFNG